VRAILVCHCSYSSLDNESGISPLGLRLVRFTHPLMSKCWEVNSVEVPFPKPLHGLSRTESSWDEQTEWSGKTSGGTTPQGEIGSLEERTVSTQAMVDPLAKFIEILHHGRGVHVITWRCGKKHLALIQSVQDGQFATDG
jgi:hypothetical protein